MKIWYDGEDTWYAAETRQEAIAEAEKYNGPLDQDMKDGFRELTEKKMSDYRFYDE